MDDVFEHYSLKMNFSGRDADVFVYRPKQIRTALPCLIMHDGQNLFDDDRASFGVSWKLREAIEKHDLKIMVVGVSCADGLNRLDEYSPFYNRDIVGLRDWLTRPAGGKGNEYIDWIVNDLIVWIKSGYSVKGEFLMAGSSMGGLISMAAMSVGAGLWGPARGPATRWWCTTREAAPRPVRPPAPGGSCAGLACPTSGCWTASTPTRRTPTPW